MDVVDYLALARLEEGRLAASFSEVADEFRPFAGGVMCRGAPGGWFNAAIGAGLKGAVAANEVRAMIAYFEERGIEPRVEACPFAHATLISCLGAERFVVRLFETVFFRRLYAGAGVDGFTPPPGLTIRPVDPHDARDVDEFARVSTSGFLPEGMAEWPDELLEIARRVARHHRTVAVMGFFDGRCVAAGGMETLCEGAALFGVSVVKDHRRGGVQMALIDWRLREAARRGARWAMISSRPGVATERNAQRAGFQVAYTKAILVRPGDGLIGVME
jgi:GNAT superfamily N-acetyltransferase